MKSLTVSGFRVRDYGRFQRHYRSFLSQGILDFGGKFDELQKFIETGIIVVAAAGHRNGGPYSDSR